MTSAKLSSTTKLIRPERQLHPVNFRTRPNAELPTAANSFSVKSLGTLADNTWPEGVLVTLRVACRASSVANAGIVLPPYVFLGEGAGAKRRPYTAWRSDPRRN